LCFSEIALLRKFFKKNMAFPKDFPKAFPKALFFYIKGSAVCDKSKKKLCGFGNNVYLCKILKK